MDRFLKEGKGFDSEIMQRDLPLEEQVILLLKLWEKWRDKFPDKYASFHTRLYDYMKLHYRQAVKRRSKDDEIEYNFSVLDEDALMDIKFEIRNLFYEFIRDIIIPRHDDAILELINEQRT